MTYEVSAEIIINPYDTMGRTSTSEVVEDGIKLYCYEKGVITSFKNGRFRELSTEKFLKDLQRIIDRITNEHKHYVEYTDGMGFIIVDGHCSVYPECVTYLKHNGFLKDGEYTGKKVSRTDLKFAFVNCAWIRSLLKRYK